MRRLFAAAAIAVLAAGSATAQTTIKFANDWKWEGPAAPLLLALDRGYYTDADLSVTMDTGSGSLDERHGDSESR